MIRNRRFSITSLLLLTALIAFAIAAGSFAIVAAKSDREAYNLRARVRVLEHSKDADRRNIEKEFFGEHGAPILAIDCRDESLVPLLIRVQNSKHTAFHYNWSFHTPTPTHVGVDLKLLRTVDGRDYYRLVYSDSNRLELGLKSPVDGQQIVLFEYTGAEKTVAASDKITIVIAPDERTAIDKLLSIYPDSLVAEKEKKWTVGPSRAYVRTFHVNQSAAQ